MLIPLICVVVFAFGAAAGAVWTWFTLNRRETPWDKVLHAALAMGDEHLKEMRRRDDTARRREQALIHAVLTNKAIGGGARIVMPQPVVEERQYLDPDDGMPDENGRVRHVAANEV